MGKKLTDKEIEMIADIYSKMNQAMLSQMEVEWLLSHSFQLGAKFYRDFINIDNK